MLLYMLLSYTALTSIIFHSNKKCSKNALGLNQLRPPGGQALNGTRWSHVAIAAPSVADFGYTNIINNLW